MATKEQKQDIINGMIHGSFDDPDSLTHWHYKKGTAIGDPIELYVYLDDLTPAAQTAVRAALDYWESVSGITFTDKDEDHADILFEFEDFSDIYTDPKKINWYGSTDPLKNAEGFKKEPDFQSTVSFNTMKGISNFENAQNNPRYWRVMIHEIGHALGLEHPHNYNDGDELENNSLYSIMAYKFSEGIPAKIPGETDDEVRLPNETAMTYDILAIQKLYHENKSYNAGDTSYSWKPGNHYLAIWDPGGKDTVDISNQNGKALIDLSEGKYGGGKIAIGNDAGQLSFYAGIAFGTVIENAIGTDQDDEITGNDKANLLKGKGGDG